MIYPTQPASCIGQCRDELPVPSSPPGSTGTENTTPSLQEFKHKPSPCPSTASKEIISNFWGLAVLRWRTFAVITHLSLLPHRVWAEEGLLRRVLLLLVCQNGRVDVPPDLREDVLLHPPSQKGKMIATEIPALCSLRAGDGFVALK